MKTNFMVISFDETGEVNAMHRDQFNLGFLGKQEINRASDIRFNEETQLWDIYLLNQQTINGELIAAYCVYDAQGFGTYEQARDAEVSWLESSALRGIDPLSEEALDELRKVKAHILAMAKL